MEQVQIKIPCSCAHQLIHNGCPSAIAEITPKSKLACDKKLFPAHTTLWEMLKECSKICFSVPITLGKKGKKIKNERGKGAYP
jgi:hypothetical protein